MTREEAKEILTHNWTRVDNPNYSESELDEAFFMAIEALSADTVSREHHDMEVKELKHQIKDRAEAVQGEWIPVSEMLPEDIKPVIVTWKNTDPKSYYQYIVGKHFIGTAHYKSGKWYWYSSVTEDLLAEYGKCDSEEFDEAIEVVAWMPLPTPYKGGDDE